MSNPDASILKVRRSILIDAPPAKVWEAFTSKAAMDEWWGKVTGTPEAGETKGQWLDRYEPRVGGRIEMAVMWDGARACYGGTIRTFESARELSFDNDWIPNQGWAAPTFMTLRLTPALGGTLVELFHHGFEHTGGDFGAEHAGYETGWGMLQLGALKGAIEASR